MILDTNGLSAFIDGEPSLEARLPKPGNIAVPVIVLGEYRFGVRQSRQRIRYEAWLTEYLHNYRVLPVEEDTADHYAAIRGELKAAGTPIPTNDVWIAALCRQYSLPLLSRDRHFDLVRGLRRIAW